MAGRTVGAQAESGQSGDYLHVLEAALRYARERSYSGPDYGDGMSSRLLDALPVESKWLNLAVQETVKRAPVNLRPLFLVETRRNFQGIALFSMANAVAADLSGEDAYDRESRDLADWLVENRIEGRAGYCGGHQHDLQTLDGVVRVGTPGIVGTSYAVKALLQAGQRYDADYADTVRDAAEFLFEDLGYESVEDGARIDYKPGEPDEYDTLNAIALGARMLCDLYDRFGESRLKRGARELLRYVASCQTDRGGWHYREPPSASHLSMDSHHNGFVIEAFQRFRAVTESEEFDGVLADALSFYRDVLFEPDGTPNFDEESAYPRDVHAAAQGIVVWSYEGELAFARRILEWTLENLYVGGGRFYFRKHRYYTKRVVLMRWCVAWMAYAIGVFERAKRGDYSR